MEKYVYHWLQASLCLKGGWLQVSVPWDISRLWQAARSQGLRAGSHGNERRSDRRYPIHTDLEYRITKGRKVVKVGRGQTIDISSAGLLFKSPLPLPRGLKIEVSIPWPAFAAGQKKLELVAEGRTVRAVHNCTAVQIQKYAFRGQHVQ